MHWLLSVSHPSFSSLCPLSPFNALFYPTLSCCPSDLLFRPSVYLWLLVFIFFSYWKHTVFISINLPTVFAFEYFVCKVLQGFWCCNVFLSKQVAQLLDVGFFFYKGLAVLSHTWAIRQSPPWSKLTGSCCFYVNNHSNIDIQKPQYLVSDAGGTYDFTYVCTAI